MCNVYADSPTKRTWVFAVVSPASFSHMLNRERQIPRPASKQTTPHKAGLPKFKC